MNLIRRSLKLNFFIVGLAVPGLTAIPYLMAIDPTNAVSSVSGPKSPATAVDILGTQFAINGAKTYPGTRIEGLLMNSRMANAIFDDENPHTADYWKYPDTGVWDARRNTNEFIAMLPTYAAKGLKAFALGMQGGNPCQLGVEAHPWIVSAYNADGSLKAPWLERADRVIRAADRNGLVVILQYFYQHQEDRLDDNDAVLRAADNVTEWVLDQGYRNVLIEINNEVTDLYAKSILQKPNVARLIARVQSRAGERLKVSTSFRGGIIPTDAVIRQSDYVLVHGNHQTAAELRAMITAIKATPAYRAKPKPILFNEDSTSLDNLSAAVERGVSWGYHEGGGRNYHDGFQYPPINWAINTATKKAFFDSVARLAAGNDLRQSDLDEAPVSLSTDLPGSDTCLTQTASQNR